MTLTERFMGLPRAMQWSAGALVAFVLYFLVIEPALLFYTNASEDVESAQLRLTELEAQVKDRESDLTAYESGLARHGEVLPPRPADVVRPDVFELWEELRLEFASVTGLRLQTTDAGFRGAALPIDLMPVGSQLEVVRFSADFEASPEDIIAIVRRLESSPFVHSVRSIDIRLNSADERLLSANIETESWAYIGGNAQ